MFLSHFVEIRNAKIKIIEESEQEAKSQDKANLVRQQVMKVNEKVQEVKADNLKYKKENSELKDAIFKANIKKDSLILQVVSPSSLSQTYPLV